MPYKIERQKQELYPSNPSAESVRRNPSGSSVTRWCPLKYDYPTAEAAIDQAKNGMVKPGEPARVVHEPTNEVVWERETNG